MGKTANYELFLARFLLLAFLLAVANTVAEFFTKSHIKIEYFYINVIYYIIFLALILMYYRNAGKGSPKSVRLKLPYRFMPIFIILTGTVFAGMDPWGYAALFLPIMLTALTESMKVSLILVGLSFVINLHLYLIKLAFLPGIGLTCISFSHGTAVFVFSVYYILLALFVAICASTGEENKNDKLQKEILYKELEEKYQLLVVSGQETNYQLEKVRETNIKLEETNKKLNISIGEFFTLQQISKAISVIFDINELLKYVNDIIIGVMGVNYSTIILADNINDTLTVHTTNITDSEEYGILHNNINDKALLKVLKDNKSFIENFVDKNEFTFTVGRQVNSVMCVPLSTKSGKYGIVLIEHRVYNAFDEDNLRLLEIIGQQVTIALENAKLYQEMQEMAIHDGFTGVYNKQYFQELFEKEFDKAVKGGYSLSLAIMDADHFKKFNDTYGHLFGDKVLKSIVDLVRASLRENDIIARFGGEEFIILFPETELAKAGEMADSLRKKISRLTVADNLVSASVTVSFGISSFPETSASPVELIRHADNSLYKAKTSGRNCVETAGYADLA